MLPFPNDYRIIPSSFTPSLENTEIIKLLKTSSFKLRYKYENVISIKDF